MNSELLTISITTKRIKQSSSQESIIMAIFNELKRRLTNSKKGGKAGKRSWEHRESFSSDDETYSQTSSIDCDDSIASISASCKLDTATIGECKATKKSVRFDTVEVREYAVTIGTHEHVQQYPIQLDWDYMATKVSPIPEEEKSTRGCVYPLNERKRQVRLQAMGISRTSLVAMERRRKIESRLNSKDINQMRLKVRYMYE